MSSQSIVVLVLCLSVSALASWSHHHGSNEHEGYPNSVSDPNGQGANSLDALGSPNSVGGPTYGGSNSVGAPTYGNPNSGPYNNQIPAMGQTPYDAQTQNTYGNQNYGGSQAGDRSLLSLIPPIVQAFLPPAVRDELSSLTQSDAEVLRKLIMQLPQYTSVDQVRQTLHRKSPRLAAVVHAKAEAVRAYVNARREALQPDTRTLFDEAGHLARQNSNAYIVLIDRQSQGTKQDLQSNFPIIAYLVTSPAGQTLANYLRAQ